MHKYMEHAHLHYFSENTDAAARWYSEQEQQARTLYAYEAKEAQDMSLVPAPENRAWMEETPERAAYLAAPLLAANQGGWLIHSPATFRVIWDGQPGPEHLMIIFERDEPDPRIQSKLGGGVFTVTIPYLFELPRGIDLWVKGPSNWIKEGALPLEAIIQAADLPSGITMHWKLTRPGIVARFEQGEPICMVVPIAHNVAGRLTPRLLPLDRNPVLEGDYRRWQESWAQQTPASSAPTGGEQGSNGPREVWQQGYFTAGMANGTTAQESQRPLERFSKLIHIGQPKIGTPKADAPWTTEQQVKAVPAVTRKGFERARVPEEVSQALRAEFHSNRDKFVKEALDSHFHTTSDLSPCLLYEDKERNGRLLNDLKHLHEKWSGVELVASVCYGMRLYQRGSSLDVHADTLASHIVSSIINIDQCVDKPWALTIADHCGRWHDVILEPGDMLFYEGARLPHGRIVPLEGEYYCNLFLHYAPVGWNLTGDEILAQKEGLDHES